MRHPALGPFSVPVFFRLFAHDIPPAEATARGESPSPFQPARKTKTALLLVFCNLALEYRMKFGYAILYVPDVAASISFMERAFDMQRGFVHDGGDYGELATGGTTLSFAAHSLGLSNLPDGYVEANTSAKPLGMEIALVTDDVAAAHAKAVALGAVELKAPMQKPWGQTVSYLRCPDGCLVELCTPVG